MHFPSSEVPTTESPLSDSLPGVSGLSLTKLFSAADRGVSDEPCQCRLVEHVARMRHTFEVKILSSHQNCQYEAQLGIPLTSYSTPAYGKYPSSWIARLSARATTPRGSMVNASFESGSLNVTKKNGTLFSQGMRL